MALKDTMHHLGNLLTAMTQDLTKVNRGNKTAAQRVRVGTIQLGKLGKVFRKESVEAERNGRLKKKNLVKLKRKRRYTSCHK